MTITDIQILKKLLVKEGAQIHVSLDLGLENLKEGKDIQVFVDFESSDFIISKGFLKHSAFDSKKFEYIQNPDGSMRWFWPDFIEKPYFLKFYSAMGFKSRLFAKLMAILFYVPLVRNFFIKSFYFTSKENLSIGSILDTPNSPYAVFTGTAGPNRKIVVYQSNMEDTYFLKIPFGQNSSAALLNEFEKASYFRPYQKLIATPSITMSQGILRSPDMKIPTVRVDEFTEMAQKKINILVNLTRVDGFSPRFENVLEDKPSSRLMKEFYFTLSAFIINLQEQSMIFSLNHGDFTPWNTHQTDDTLLAYDLEFASFELPIYYDVFHYWIQNYIMCTSLSNVEILNTVERKWLFSAFDTSAKTMGVTYKQVLNWYILFISSHYYTVYNKQEELHYQGKKLVAFLIYAMQTLNSQVEENFRVKYVEKLSSILSKFVHAIVKQFEPLSQLNENDSDIDVVIQKKNLEHIIAQIPLDGILSKKLSVRSNMATLSLYFNDMTFLSIDFIFEFKRKSLVYLSAVEVLKKARKASDNLWYADLTSNTAYILNFYLLNGASVPEKYVKVLNALPEQQIEGLEKYIVDKYGFSLKASLENRAHKNQDIVSKLKKVANQNEGNRGLESKINYLMDTIKIFSKQKGKLITFSGVDGAGKTTVIEQVTALIENRFRNKVIYLRHRPSILPILSAYVHGKEKASQISMSKLPRQGGNKSKITSFIRFLYYYTDYVFGQFYVYWKYTKRGYDVIYDRYYYDFILDGIRSNINLGQKFPKLLFALVFKPELNFFLYASPEVILARKKEMPSKDIIEMTEAYQTLFKEFGQKYKVHFESIENIELEQTIEIIAKRYLSLQ